MLEVMTGFESLPDDYQQVIRLAENHNNITVTPLQLLVGGWSGAVVYLVSVSTNDSGRVEHCILKLDRKGKSSKSDEVTRHNIVLGKSTATFARAHIAEMVFERVEFEGAIGIFYRIAGQSLLDYLPLSSYEQQSQLKTIFIETNTVLLSEWNTKPAIEQAVHPQKVLEEWLGFRLEAGGNIERFLKNSCQVNPDIASLLINGIVFPNPLIYARKREYWGKTRPIDIAAGLLHGDLNTNNILAKFSKNDGVLEGYYLIDFALFKEYMPLLYDQRYLEMSYLLLSLSQASLAKCISFITRMAEADIPDPHKVSIEFSGINEVIASTRRAFARWVQENHPSLNDDLWGQYWLAGVAAGLSYCHKAGQTDEQRLAGLIYAAANLKRFASVFGLPLPVEAALLYDESQAGTESHSSPVARKPNNNLPSQPTPFIGRLKQIAAIKEMLLDPDVRLLTLTGPGGTGKTRLSLQAAQELLEHFPQGVFFVPLADDTDPDQFVARVAQQLDVREGGRPLLENVKDYLREKCLLLVLDNFEQLVSTAPIAAELLAAAMQLKIMVSSRTALNLHGEREFPVPPLDLPEEASELTTENLAGNESVRLFVERARAVNPNFALTDDNDSTVIGICRRLDGLPLALELAAARIKLLSPQAILSRLDDRLNLLTGGARDLPARQQTLRNTLEWSYDLLNEAEKTLYTRLAVFVGGFTLEAAEAICNPEGQLDILENLAALVNHSLLRREDTADGEPRFGMLETIRAYALERLADSSEMEALRQKHAGYFGDVIINQMGLQIYTAQAFDWLNWLEREQDNIRATLAWCLTMPSGSELGAGLIFNLAWFWYRRGYLIEGRMWCERVLALPAMQTASPLRALALISSGLLALWMGEQDTALGQFQEGLALEQRFEDEFMMAGLLMANAVALLNKGQDGLAKPLLEQARAEFKALHQASFHAITVIHLGNVELGLGNPGQAHRLHEEALAEARAIGENWLLSFALNNLGEVARAQGQYDLARTYYEECEVLLRSTGDKGDVARFVHSLGYIAQHEGDLKRAENQFRKSLAMFRQLGNRRGMAECLAGLAGLRARLGDPQWGACMLSAAESLLQVKGGAWWPADRLEVERNREFIHAALDEATLAAALEKGRAMSLEQALAFASTAPERLPE